MRPSTAIADMWRRLPRSWRHQFWTAVQAGRRASLPLRVARHWRRGRRGSGAVAVVGLLRDTRGVGEAARLLAAGLEQSGFDVSRRDAGPALRMPPVLAPAPESDTLAPADLIVSCLNPPELLRWLDATGGRELRGRRHVGCWAWELPVAPPEWRKALRFVDEVWCHSEFAAAAIRDLAAGQVPVSVLPPPVFAIPAAVADRSSFELPEEACVVLSVMDLRSSATRKNPEGALAAYLAARPEPSSDALLVCKVSGLESRSDVAAALRRAAANRPDIRLITELLPAERMHALTASADIVLSLHRAEGFGLMAAEAAFLGKAVVTTGWSAPLEFLTPEGAALVGWAPVAVDDPQKQYGGAGAVWADPDVAEASRRLAALIDAPQARATMGAAARRRADEAFGARAWATQARRLLA